MPFLTDDLIRTLPTPAKNNGLTWDADADGAPGSGVAGLGACVTPAGSKSLIFNYRINGTMRRLKLGRWPAVKVEAARAKARKLQGGREPRRGRPQSARAAARLALTVNKVADRMLTERASDLRASTLENYERLLRALPAPGDRPGEAHRGDRRPGDRAAAQGPARGRLVSSQTELWASAACSSASPIPLASSGPIRSVAAANATKSRHGGRVSLDRRDQPPVARARRPRRSAVGQCASSC